VGISIPDTIVETAKQEEVLACKISINPSKYISNDGMNI
jgi:hypothetical protein